MFEGFSVSTIDFMWNLRLNNEKPWFEAHKEEYLRDFLNPMKTLGREVFDRVIADFGGHGFIHKVSRIYRDARRVRGGEPYRDHLWFSIERPSEEWTSTPVFWFELSPENWSYGLVLSGQAGDHGQVSGAHRPQPHKVRTADCSAGDTGRVRS